MCWYPVQEVGWAGSHSQVVGFEVDSGMPPLAGWVDPDRCAVYTQLRVQQIEHRVAVTLLVANAPMAVEVG